MIEGNGPLGGVGGGIFVDPSGSPTVTVSVSNSQSSNNGFGLRVDTSAMSGGSVYSTVADSEMNGNQAAGIAAVTAAASGRHERHQHPAHDRRAQPRSASTPTAARPVEHIGSSILFDSSNTGAKTANGGTIDSTGGQLVLQQPDRPGPRR